MALAQPFPGAEWCPNKQNKVSMDSSRPKDSKSGFHVLFVRLRDRMYRCCERCLTLYLRSTLTRADIVPSFYPHEGSPVGSACVSQSVLVVRRAT